jgi:rfaE bifunctional protein nucleotidyltransferase chain/domain
MSPETSAKPYVSEVPDVGHAKVLPLRELAEVLQDRKAAGQSVAHCHGCFDLLHPGHLQHLRQAKKLADLLVVTVTQDQWVNKGPNRPVFPVDLRAESLASIDCVDFVAINLWPSASETIRLLKPDIYVKGGEYKDLEDPIGQLGQEVDAVGAVGGRIEFTGGVTFSSSALLNQHFSTLSREAGEFLERFKQQATDQHVFQQLERFTNIRPLVIGEAIIDEYHFATPVGKSSKSAAISARMEHAETYAGGALAVANHLAAFCPEVQLVTCPGTGPYDEAFIADQLASNVKPVFVPRPDAPTIVKRRYIQPASMMKLFEVGFFDDRPVDAETAEKLTAVLDKHLDRSDMTLAADFGHGMLTAPIRELLCRRSRYLAVSSQTNSVNFGFNPVTHYRHADYVCQDRSEARLAVHNPHADVPELVDALTRAVACRHLAMPLGEEGCASWSRGRLSHVPALACEVVDTVGAGTAFFALTAPAAYLGLDPDMLGFLGNVAGASAAKTVGNRECIQAKSFRRFISTLLK